MCYLLLRNHERTMKLLKCKTFHFVPIQRLLIRKRRHMIIIIIYYCALCQSANKNGIGFSICFGLVFAVKRNWYRCAQ